MQLRNKFPNSWQVLSSIRRRALASVTALAFASPVYAHANAGQPAAQKGAGAAAEASSGTVPPAADKGEAAHTNAEGSKKAQAAAPGKRDLRNLPGQQVLIGGLSLSVGAGVVAGQSTFQVAPGFADNAFVAWSTSVGAAYQFSDRTRLRVGTGINQELTVPNGQDERYTLILGDTSVGLSRPLHRLSFGTLLLGSASVRLPTSEASRIQTLRAATTLSGRAIQPLGKLTLVVGSSFGKNFHKYTNPVIDPRGQGTLVTRDRLVSAPNLIAVGRAGGNEVLSPSEQALGGSNNRSFSIRNSLSVSYSLSSHIGLSVGYSLGHSWGYQSFDLDDMAGVGARAGRGRRDFQSGSLFAGYILNRRVSFSAGMSTAGSPRTADDRRLRFPFFTFANQGVENNLTTFSLGVSFRERVHL